MDQNQKLMADQGEPLSDLERYRRLIKNLIYVTITIPNLPFVMGVISEFIQNLCIYHWSVIIHILKWPKRALGQGLMYKYKGQGLLWIDCT